MAARGTAEKEFITAKIMEVFPDAFINGKELRIPIVNGVDEIQIKVTLTAAKDNMAHNYNSTATNPIETSAEPAQPDLTGPDEQEKQSVVSLLELIGVK